MLWLGVAALAGAATATLPASARLATNARRIKFFFIGAPRVVVLTPHLYAGGQRLPTGCELCHRLNRFVDTLTRPLIGLVTHVDKRLVDLQMGPGIA